MGDTMEAIVVAKVIMVARGLLPSSSEVFWAMPYLDLSLSCIKHHLLLSHVPSSNSLLSRLHPIQHPLQQVVTMKSAGSILMIVNANAKCLLVSLNDLYDKLFHQIKIII